jgi:hypothetical protein
MKRWELSPSLIAQLEAAAARRNHTNEIIEQENAFLLDPGMGPAMYLTRDGRVLIDSRGWDDSGIHEADEGEAVAAFVVGARKTGVTALLELLPDRPSDALDCETCNGRRSVSLGADISTGRRGEILCFACGGHGSQKAFV